MGRDIPAIKISGEDRRRYREKLRRSLDVFARMLREARFESDPRQVGLEIELNLVDEHALPSMRNAAVLNAIADPAWATELGQFNIEINVPPRGIGQKTVGEVDRFARELGVSWFEALRRLREGTPGAPKLSHWVAEITVGASLRPWVRFTSSPSRPRRE